LWILQYVLADAIRTFMLPSQFILSFNIDVIKE